MVYGRVGGMMKGAPDLEAADEDWSRDANQTSNGVMGQQSRCIDQKDSRVKRMSDELIAKVGVL